jgi:hypothetical protein
VTIATCVPADPQSKGGSEATVRVAKADLVPTDHNLLDNYEDFAALEAACAEFCDRVNTREHRVTRRPPVVMLADVAVQGSSVRLEGFPVFAGNLAVCGVMRSSWCGRRGVTRSWR